MRTLARGCALVCALNLGISLLAQVAPGKPGALVATDTAMAEGLKLRVDTTATVASGETKPEEAITALKAHDSPSGLKIDSDGDFAIAAIDVGRRLIALHKPVEAEVFFHAAEDSLGLVIGRTADSAAKDKVQYLSIRASIRAGYLNKLIEARADLDTAQKLAPENRQLKQMTRLLTADPAATIKNHKEQPTRG